MFSIGGGEGVRKRRGWSIARVSFHRSGPQSLDHQSTAQLKSYANYSVDWPVIETKLDNCSSPDTKRLENFNLVCKHVHSPLPHLFEASNIEANNPLWVRSKARLVEFSSKYVRCIPKTNLLEGGFHNSRRCPLGNRP
jgi:hypothetical protein